MMVIQEAPVKIGVYNIPLDDIVRDPRCQMRVSMDAEVISEYAEAMREGATFPPISVVQNEEGAYVLYDGFHRVEAAGQAGLETMPTTIAPGTTRLAILKAAGANQSHGIRRTNAASGWRSRAF